MHRFFGRTEVLVAVDLCRVCDRIDLCCFILEVILLQPITTYNVSGAIISSRTVKTSLSLGDSAVLFFQSFKASVRAKYFSPFFCFTVFNYIFCFAIVFVSLFGYLPVLVNCNITVPLLRCLVKYTQQS